MVSIRKTQIGKKESVGVTGVFLIGLTWTVSPDRGSNPLPISKKKRLCRARRCWMLLYCTSMRFDSSISTKNYLSRWEWSINNSLKFQVNLYLKRDGRAYYRVSSKLMIFRRIGLVFNINEMVSWRNW